MGVDGRAARRVLKSVADRRQRARSVGVWSQEAEAALVRSMAAEAAAAGPVDHGLLDALEARVLQAVDEALSRHVAPVVPIAARAVSTRVFGDKSYRNRLDRQLAVGATASALTLSEMMGLAALTDVVRRAAIEGDRLVPALPGRVLIEGDGA